MFFPSFTFWRTAPAFVSVASSFRNITVSGDLYIVNGNTSYQPSHGEAISRPAVLAGLAPGEGTFPGPTINGWKGSTFSINVHNQLQDGRMLRETTIHWHGIDQINGTGWADGVAFVTQCPIIPDDYFPYKFPVPDQAGTFWYHSHYSTQYCDGLRGPLIIRDKEDPYLKDYDIDDDINVAPGNVTDPAGSAILQYEGASSDQPITSGITETITLDEALMVPYYPAPAPGGSDPDAKDVVNHDITLNYTSEGFTINGHRFRPPSVDVLLQILSRAKKPADLLPPGAVITLPRNATIQLRFLNAGKTAGAPHPFHLHGHTFSVVRSILHDEYNWENPPRRDTVATARFNEEPENLDEVTIRFTTDNPGPWILHCHIDWHLESGLALVFAEDFDSIASWEKNIPDKWHDGCDKYWKWMGRGPGKRDVLN